MWKIMGRYGKGQIEEHVNVRQKSKFIVVCPDDRFAGPLRDQGIYFVKYEPEEASFDDFDDDDGSMTDYGEI